MIQYKYILYMCIISYLFFLIVEEQCDWRFKNGFCKYVFIVLSTIFVYLLDFARFSFSSACYADCSCTDIVHFKYWFYGIVVLRLLEVLEFWSVCISYLAACIAAFLYLSIPLNILLKCVISYKCLLMNTSTYIIYV